MNHEFVEGTVSLTQLYIHFLTSSGRELLSAIPDTSELENDVITRQADHPILFLHSEYGGAWMWEPAFLPWFASRGFSSYALSYKGHGESQGGDHVVKMELSDFVEDLDLCIEHIKETTGALF